MNGVTLMDIVRHVKKSLGVTVSKHTVHRLMRPSRRKTVSSKRFKCYIDARVPPKRNTATKPNADFHYTCTQVNLVNEMAELCRNNTLSLSVDNKNKVEVGIPATSRRSQIRTFYLKDDSPNFHDHDFPHRNCKLVPAGYQILRNLPRRSKSLSPVRNNVRQLRKRSLSESRVNFKSLTKDKIGRDKIKWPRCGPLFVEVYPSRLMESTNTMHVNKLISLIRNERKIHDIANVVMIADGGPDWSVKGIINFMSLGYLWEVLKLDTFVIQCYAAGHSRFNPIERSWSFLTNRIVGVTIPDAINGQTPKPNDDVGWMQVLDNAAEILAKFWDKKIYNGHAITVETFLSTNNSVKDLKNTHELLKEFAYASSKKIRENPHLQELQKQY